MKIGEFVKTEEGKKFEDVLKGCSKNWECQHWDSKEEYADCLRGNGYSEEDIILQIYHNDFYFANPDDKDFVEVIN